MISARANAVETLGNPGDSGPEVLKLIAEAWNDDSALVRVRAAKAVGMMGEKILNRIPQLVAGLDGLIREGLTNSEGAAASRRLIWLRSLVLSGCRRLRVSSGHHGRTKINTLEDEPDVI